MTAADHGPAPLEAGEGYLHTYHHNQTVVVGRSLSPHLYMKFHSKCDYTSSEAISSFHRNPEAPELSASPFMKIREKKGTCVKILNTFSLLSSALCYALCSHIAFRGASASINARHTIMILDRKLTETLDIRT